MISIIIPTLNTNPTLLENCLNSIHKQTYKNFEVILVDGGSSSAILKLLTTHCNKDRRFKLINSPKGVSNQRNNGIKSAKGDYIAFIDSDDYINSCYFEELIKEINNGFDIVNANIVLINNGRVCDDLKNDIHIYDLNKHNYFKFLLDNVPLVYPIKLYKKSLVLNQRFNTNISVGEDMFFNYQILCDNGSIKYSVCSKAKYYYNYFSDELFLKKYCNEKLNNTYDELYNLYLKTNNIYIIRYIYMHYLIYFTYASNHHVKIPFFFKKYNRILLSDKLLNLNKKQKLFLKFPHVYNKLKFAKQLFKKCLSKKQ